MSLDTYRNSWDPFYNGARALVDRHFQSLYGNDNGQDEKGQDDFSFWGP